MFKKIDKNASGTLTKSEIRKGFDMFGKPISDEQINAIFDAVDSNHNGKINYTEFLIAASDAESLHQTKNLEIAFKAFAGDNGRVNCKSINEFV